VRRFLPIFAAACSALIAVSCGRPPSSSAPDPFVILTPPPAATPRINGAQVFGVRPGSPFLFQIAATGERPMEFSADGLPDGLSLDSATGRISGVLPNPGEHTATLRAVNSLGMAERPLRIVVGEQIALTPPMGWNSWNAWGLQVTQDKVRAAAHALAATGLRDHGWSYVNIDDGWQGIRGGPFNAIQPNTKFPDIKALSDEIHALGLKLGIYSSPARATFGRHIGSSADTASGSYHWIEAGDYNEFYQYDIPESRSRFDGYTWLKPLAERSHKRERKKFTSAKRSFGQFSFVTQDVRQWVEWGVDYLKYDWVPIDLPHAAEMNAALRRSGRDFVYSISNNARLDVATELVKLANSWRTTVDIKDTWESVCDIGFGRDEWAPFNGPGHYSDADMLVLGWFLGPLPPPPDASTNRPGPTRLTSAEQYAHMSLWCLLSGPLLIGCDLEKLDPFTLNLLTNDEVLDVNQDALCKQATRVAHAGSSDVYAKPLADGSWAVGLFNRGDRPTIVRAKWTDVGLSGKHRVRDLWRQQDVGVFEQGFEADIAPHGVMLVRVSRAN
jgi:alpha-galactosidase